MSSLGTNDFRRIRTQATRLFVRQLVHAINKQNQTPDYWPILSGIHMKVPVPVMIAFHCAMSHFTSRFHCREVYASYMYVTGAMAAVLLNRRLNYAAKWVHVPHDWPFVPEIHRSKMAFPRIGSIMSSFGCVFVGLVKPFNKRSRDQRNERSWRSCDVTDMRGMRCYGNRKWESGCGCNTEYLSETHLKLKSREISFVHDL